MYFEWDENKNGINNSKHGLDFSEVSQIWNDPNNFDIYDENHSNLQEHRWLKFGRLFSGKVVCVVYTLITEERCRIISAFSDNKIERLYYEENK